MEGWVHLHRKLLNNCIAGKAEYLALWITLLLMANHKDGYSFILNNKKIELKKGQLLTGRKKLAIQTGIHESNVFRILKYLENEHQIEQQKTSKYTIITILNWDRHNDVEQLKEQQMNNKRTTNEQQMNTYKNDKNIENIKNKDIIINDDRISSEKLFIENKEEILLRAKELNPSKNVEVALEDFVDYIRANKTKYKDFRLAFLNWVKNDRFGKYGGIVKPKHEIDMI